MTLWALYREAHSCLVGSVHYAFNHSALRSGPAPKVTQRPMANTDTPHIDNVGMSRPQTASSCEQLLCDGPGSSVDVDGDVVAVVIHLYLSTDIAIVDRISQAGNLLGGSAFSHGTSLAVRLAPSGNPFQRRPDAVLRDVGSLGGSVSGRGSASKPPPSVHRTNGRSPPVRRSSSPIPTAPLSRSRPSDSSVESVRASSQTCAPELDRGTPMPTCWPSLPRIPRSMRIYILVMWSRGERDHVTVT